MKLLFNKQINNKKRLENLLRFSQDIVNNNYSHTAAAIFHIIKILTDRINSTQCIDRLCENLDDNIFPEDISDDFITDTKYEVIIDKPLTIFLNRNPVLVNLKDRDKIIDNLITVGTKENKWKQNTSTGTDKHCFNLFLPIGVTDICEGNHSAFSGIVKGVGELTFNPKDSEQKVFDISYLYDKIYYDGYHYRDIKSNKRIGSVPYEYGCIFEIGRIISKSNISFLKMKQSEYEQFNK